MGIFELPKILVNNIYFDFYAIAKVSHIRFVYHFL
jgi:hypothetical protein